MESEYIRNDKKYSHLSAEERGKIEAYLMLNFEDSTNDEPLEIND